MVQILPEVPGFGAMLARGLGAGLSQGVNKASEFAMQMGLKNFEANKRRQLMEEMKKNYGYSEPDDFSSEFKNQKEPNYLDIAEAMAASGEHDLANVYAARGKIQAKERQSREERNYKASEAYLDEARKSKEELIGQQASLEAAKQAVLSGEEGLSKDFWINTLGLPSQLKSSSGATLDAAAKTHLLTSMKNLSGGRPNMFLEKQISQAFAMPGGSRKGNLAKLEILQTLADMKQFQVDKALSLEDQYLSEGKELPGNIGRIALKEVLPEIEKRQKQLSYRLQEYMEPDEGSADLDKIKEVPKGTPLTQKKAKVIFLKANPGKKIEDPLEKKIERATKLAEGLGYDVNVFDLME